MTASGPSASISTFIRWSTALFVPRSYSAQADVSAKIMHAVWGDVGRRLTDGMRSPQRQCLFAAHRLPGQVSQRQIDSIGLGPNALA